VRRKSSRQIHTPPIQHINATEKINPSKKHNKKYFFPVKIYQQKINRTKLNNNNVKNNILYEKFLSARCKNKIYLTKYSTFQ